MTGWESSVDLLPVTGGVAEQTAYTCGTRKSVILCRLPQQGSVYGVSLLVIGFEIFEVEHRRLLTGGLMISIEQM